MTTSRRGQGARLVVVQVMVLSLFATLFARLWYLQVISGTQAQAAAQNQGVRIVYTPAPRGRILDRNGMVLADNGSACNLPSSPMTPMRVRSSPRLRCALKPSSLMRSTTCSIC